MSSAQEKKQKYRSKVEKGLDKALYGDNTTTIERELSTAKIVVFSDHHRGVGDGADDFCDCCKAYCAALGYYLESGYTLILAGDAEDLWECRPGPVIRRYRTTLLLESEFMNRGKDRYYRVYGNHDDLWFDSAAINKHLASHMPHHQEIRVYETLHLNLNDGGNTYKFFLVHGHQGTLNSDTCGPVSRFLVRYFWRPVQRVTKIKSTTPAINDDLSGTHDIAMYTWALGKWKSKDERRAVLIAGHTHEPVFTGRTFITKLKQELSELQKENDQMAPPNPESRALAKKIAEKRAELEYVRAEHGDSNESDGYSCYFNTGCCSFGDGDITGIEIADGQIKLVRWPDDTGSPKPKELDHAQIKDIFAELEKV